MRRKDWKYYLKTVQLKIQAREFYRSKSTENYQASIQQRREEYRAKLQEVELRFYDFDPFYHTYFYMKTLSIFSVYEKEGGVPIRLHSQTIENPLLPFYFALIANNIALKTGRSSPLLLNIKDVVTRFAQDDNQEILFPYKEDYDLFSLKAPWLSGITQALATSYYCRLYHFEENELYLEKAKRSFQVMLKSTEKGGLLCSTKSGMEWVEEYPSKESSYVLNGHIFAIISAIELFQLSADKHYALVATQWINSLLHHLPEYQYKGYLLHNKMQSKLSNIEYQGLYIGLFKHLHVLTKHPLFLELYNYYDEQISWKDFYRFYGIRN